MRPKIYQILTPDNDLHCLQLIDSQWQFSRIKFCNYEHEYALEWTDFIWRNFKM
jgi:hypothetical protein